MKTIKKLFGGIDLTWPKLIIFAIVSGIVTALFALIPIFRNTSFITITTTLEVWILLGIIIILNSKSNLDSALKCFVFFLISQPLVYLIQVPFSELGWQIFSYYRFWFIFTLLCFPMGFVGYYMKKNKWWGYLIVLPMIIITFLSYLRYFADFQFYFPFYILIVLFCAAAMILYPVIIFKDKKIQITGMIIGMLLVIMGTIYCLINPPIYSAEIMSNGDEYQFDDTYSVYFEDKSYGDINIAYYKQLEKYIVKADFKKAGKTVIVLEAPDGSKEEYNIAIKRYTYEITKKD